LRCIRIQITLRPAYASHSQSTLPASAGQVTVCWRMSIATTALTDTQHPLREVFLFPAPVPSPCFVQSN
jgi:hypothetical protein